MQDRDGRMADRCRHTVAIIKDCLTEKDDF